MAAVHRVVLRYLLDVLPVCSGVEVELEAEEDDDERVERAASSLSAVRCC